MFRFSCFFSKKKHSLKKIDAAAARGATRVGRRHYAVRHPELEALCEQASRAVLLARPVDVLGFLSDYFRRGAPPLSHSWPRVTAVPDPLREEGSDALVLVPTTRNPPLSSAASAGPDVLSGSPCVRLAVVPSNSLSTSSRSDATESIGQLLFTARHAPSLAFRESLSLSSLSSSSAPAPLLAVRAGLGCWMMQACRHLGPAVELMAALAVDAVALGPTELIAAGSEDRWAEMLQSLPCFAVLTNVTFRAPIAPPSPSPSRSYCRPLPGHAVGQWESCCLGQHWAGDTGLRYLPARFDGHTVLVLSFIAPETVSAEARMAVGISEIEGDLGKALESVLADYLSSRPTAEPAQALTILAVVHGPAAAADALREAAARSFAVRRVCGSAATAASATAAQARQGVLVVSPPVGVLPIVSLYNEESPAVAGQRAAGRLPALDLLSLPLQRDQWAGISLQALALIDTLMDRCKPAASGGLDRLDLANLLNLLHEADVREGGDGLFFLEILGGAESNAVAMIKSLDTTDTGLLDRDEIKRYLLRIRARTAFFRAAHKLMAGALVGGSQCSATWWGYRQLEAELGPLGLDLPLQQLQRLFAFTVDPNSTGRTTAKDIYQHGSVAALVEGQLARLSGVFLAVRKVVVRWEEKLAESVGLARSLAWDTVPLARVTSSAAGGSLTTLDPPHWSHMGNRSTALGTLVARALLPSKGSSSNRQVCLIPSKSCSRDREPLVGVITQREACLMLTDPTSPLFTATLSPRQLLQALLAMLNPFARDRLRLRRAALPEVGSFPNLFGVGIVVDTEDLSRSVLFAPASNPLGTLEGALTSAIEQQPFDVTTDRAGRDLIASALGLGPDAWEAVKDQDGRSATAFGRLTAHLEAEGGTLVVESLNTKHVFLAGARGAEPAAPFAGIYKDNTFVPVSQGYTGALARARTAAKNDRTQPWVPLATAQRFHDEACAIMATTFPLFKSTLDRFERENKPKWDEHLSKTGTIHLDHWAESQVKERQEWLAGWGAKSQKEKK
jgi:hypothetical protein